MYCLIKMTTIISIIESFWNLNIHMLCSSSIVNNAISFFSSTIAALLSLSTTISTCCPELELALLILSCLMIFALISCLRSMLPPQAKPCFKFGGWLISTHQKNLHYKSSSLNWHCLLICANATTVFSPRFVGSYEGMSSLPHEDQTIEECPLKATNNVLGHV